MKNGWWFNVPTQEYWLYRDGEVTTTIALEAWADYRAYLESKGELLPI